MPESRLLSPDQWAAVASDLRLAEVIGVVLDAAATTPARLPALARLAKVAHVSARTLERRLRRDLGTSYRRFKQQLRVRLAERRLADRNAPEKSVALDVGYASASSLVRSFVQIHNVTPRGRRARRRTRRKTAIATEAVTAL